MLTCHFGTKSEQGIKSVPINYSAKILNGRIQPNISHDSIRGVRLEKFRRRCQHRICEGRKLTSRSVRNRDAPNIPRGISVGIPVIAIPPIHNCAELQPSVDPTSVMRRCDFFVRLIHRNPTFILQLRILDRTWSLRPNVEPKCIWFQRGEKQNFIFIAHRRCNGKEEPAVSRREPRRKEFCGATTDEGFGQIESDGRCVGRGLIEDGHGASGQHRERECVDGVREPMEGLGSRRLRCGCSWRRGSGRRSGRRCWR